ncbi:ABC transporter permease subunit [Mycoplasmopsis cricetuli]|uniref:ABC transporter permease subunit n=1 Tax=Mycoplasmopsis cricetuli TaxID=171283 RepID=UPI0004716242|nr:ABC transporter permease subunit [Mycoplasmopsis cricetuli]
MQNKFSFIKNKNNNNKLNLSNISKKQLFWKSFWNKKINKFLIFLFLLINFILILCSLFYPYSSLKADFDSKLVQNLPSVLTPKITRSYEKDAFVDYLFYLKENNLLNIENIINYQSTFTLTYNPYQLLRTLDPTHNYFFIFGTNHNGIDNFAIFINSFLVSLIILILCAIFQLILGLVFGTIIGYYYNFKLPKITHWSASVIMIVPFLLMSLILFQTFGYSFWKAVLILTFIGFFPVFYNSYNYSASLVSKDFIVAYKVLGLSDLKIIWKITKICFFEMLPLIGEQFALGLLSLAALSFFEIPNIYNYNNIGNLYKQIIDNPNNILLFIATFMLSVFYIGWFKIISFSLTKNYFINR